VLLDDWKYVAAWSWVPPGERWQRDAGRPDAPPDLWGPPLREELYHLGDDPGERNDRMASDAAVARELAGVLERFRDTGPNYGFAAAAAAGPTPEEAARLRALGYRE